MKHSRMNCCSWPLELEQHVVYTVSWSFLLRLLLVMLLELLSAILKLATLMLDSCLYLLLLYRHTDNLSKDDIPEIFLKNKVKKKIGITSEDLKNTIEKTLGGTSVALSSPRLVIPAVIFGLSALSDHFQSIIFSFELLPGMMGFLAYKAAALVQVYRDNEDLRLILPEEEDTDRDDNGSGTGEVDLYSTHHPNCLTQFAPTKVDERNSVPVLMSIGYPKSTGCSWIREQQEVAFNK